MAEENANVHSLSEYVAIGFFFIWYEAKVSACIQEMLFINSVVAQ